MVTTVPGQNRPMKGTLTVDGAGAEATVDSVTRAVESGDPYWLDLDGLDQESTQLLAETLGLHPLAVEDAEHFGQRPKIDEFDEFTYFVVHGALPDELRHVRAPHLPAGPRRHHRAPRGVPGAGRRARTRRRGDGSSRTSRPRCSSST